LRVLREALGAGPASSTKDAVPLTSQHLFLVVIVEDLAHEESPEIHHEVFEGHPEDAVILPNF
jgi:hypothetical protein